MAEVVGEAEVLITADFGTFDEQLKARLIAAAKVAGAEAEKILKRSGKNAGEEFSRGVSKATSSQKTLDSITASIKRLETAAARAGDVQADAAGRARVAEEALAKIKEKSPKATDRIVAAEERLAKARRDVARTDRLAAVAESALSDARSKLATAAAGEGEAAADSFGRSFETKLRKVVNKSSDGAGKDGGNFFSRAFESAASKSIGKGLFAALIASVGGLITAASPLSTVLGGGTAAIVALAAALAQASGAAISLGGVLGALGLAAAAVKVGFSGVGDAVKAQAAAQKELAATGAVSAATQKKLDESLKGLAPSARAVVVELGKMTPAWKAVTKAVQQKLFAGVSTELAALGQRFLPILTTQLGTAATTLNRTGVQLAQFFSSANRGAQINTIFTGLNGILKTLLSPLKTLAGGFLDIFTASLPFAQQLATVLANIGTQFGTWLGKVADGDGFQKFMQTAMQTAGNLFQLLGNIGSIIGSVFAAGSATGGNLLVILRDLAGQAALFLKSTEGKAALASFFGLIAQAGTVLVGVFKTLSPLLSGIGALFQALQVPLKTLGSALTGVIGLLASTIGQALSQLGPVLGQLVTALSPVITILGGVLSGVLRALIPVILSIVTAFASLIPTVTPLLALLGPALVGIVQQLAGALVQIVPVLAQFIGAIVTGLQPVLSAILPVLSQLVTAALGLVPPLLQILTAMLPLVPVGAQLSLAFAQLILALTPLVTTILVSLASLLTTLAPVFLKLVGPITFVIVQLTNLVLGMTLVISKVAQFAAQLISGFSRARDGAIAAVSALISRVVGFFVSLPGKIGSAMVAFGDKVRAGIDKVVAFFASLPGKVVAGISGLRGQLEQAARNAMDGLIGGLEGALGRVREVAGNIAKAITGPVAKFLESHSPSKVMQRLGHDAAQGIINGLREKIPAVAAAARNLAAALPNQVGSAVNKLNTALNGLGKNLPSVIKQRLNTAVATTRVALATLGRSQDALNAKLKTAQTNLQDLLQKSQQLSQAVVSSIVATGNIAQGQDTSFTSIVTRLKSAVAQAKQFATTLAALKAAGLNATGLQQIIDAGPEAGLAAGKAVLAAGKAGVNQINTLQAQLQVAANKAAKTASDAIFGQGIQIAAGIVAGLKKQKASLDAQMLRLADILVARVLRVLRQVKLKGTGTLDIPGFADGGVVRRDSLIRAGERNKPEAVVPLTKPARAKSIMDSTGLSALTGQSGGKSRTVEVPINVQGNLVDYDALTRHIESVLVRFGFRPVLGLTTAGGAL